MIAKKAHKANNFKRELISYPRARDAWQAVLQAYHKQYPKAKVILPAYIGWTVTEGSGIFDPVTNVGIDYEFYGLNKMLRIDFEDMKRVISANPGAMVLMVHYFGFPDDRYSEIVLWLKKEGVFFIEDLAHAMLTDLIGGACGRAGNYSFYSLHKNLPFPDGGMLAM
ncbi:MAG: DegT/DnrJ/EryC1/StrS family aminotransferase, partial [Bacteroidia bacterium]|nr:DegT/DnrJ/EryC1/StrS family aminotransferase [Bacteroidia bacterium]